MLQLLLFLIFYKINAADNSVFLIIVICYNKTSRSMLIIGHLRSILLLLYGWTTALLGATNSFLLIIKILTFNNLSFTRMIMSWIFVAVVLWYFYIRKMWMLIKTLIIIVHIVIIIFALSGNSLRRFYIWWNPS